MSGHGHYSLARRGLALLLSLGFIASPGMAMATSTYKWMNRKAPAGQTVMVSLPLVVERALNDNLTVLSTKSQVGVSQGRFIQSFAPLFPSFRGLYYVEKFKGGEVILGAQPVELDRTTFRPTLGADYTLNTGGKALFQIMASRQQLNRAKLGVTMAQQKVLLDACTSYFTWLKDTERVRVASMALSEAETQKRYKELRLEADVGTSLEVMQTQTLVRERQNLLLSTQSERANAGYGLLGHLNLPMTLSLSAETQDHLVPLTFLPTSQSLDLQELYRIAEIHRTDLKALKAQITEAKAQLGVAVSDVFPTITLSGYTRRIGPAMDDLRRTDQGAVSVSVDLLKNMGVNTIGAIKSASSRIKETGINHERQIQDIHKTIAQAVLDLKLFEDQMALDRQRVREAEETFKVAQSRFEAGVALNLEVIQAENILTNTRLGLQTAVMNYNVAQLRLLYELGQLTPDSILTAHAASLHMPAPTAQSAHPAMAANQDPEANPESDLEIPADSPLATPMTGSLTTPVNAASPTFNLPSRSAQSTQAGIPAKAIDAPSLSADLPKEDPTPLESSVIQTPPSPSSSTASFLNQAKPSKSVASPVVTLD